MFMGVKSRFIPSENQSIQSSEYVNVSMQSLLKVDSLHSVDANTYSKNVQLTVGTNSDKFTTENGLQTWHYTAHAPIFQSSQIQPKSESDSEVSKGIVETSDDFENMQTNNNFGKFEQTSKFNFEVEMSRQQMNESENLFSLDESIAGIVDEMGKNVNIVANKVQRR